MQTHNQELIRQLKIVVGQLEMAIEDAAEDFGQGQAHAEIALTTLRGVVDACHARKAA